MHMLFKIPEPGISTPQNVCGDYVSLGAEMCPTYCDGFCMAVDENTPNCQATCVQVCFGNFDADCVLYCGSFLNFLIGTGDS